MATVNITAFDAKGYSMLIAVLDEQQLRMHVDGIDTNDFDIIHVPRRGDFGSGVSIDPSKFPEMVKFIVTVEGDRKRGE